MVTTMLSFEYMLYRERVWVTLSLPHGAQGGYWHVNIDKYHKGELYKRNGRWEFSTDRLDCYDTERLGAIIDDREYWDNVLN
jgi:hypothetical protein